ncbi:NAD(P)-binding protein [Paenibacillus sp. LMG 31460]|uniref:NAD(P)-binding protein n=1 Tax=Paenibacillus germinis TaxID=2654979 RepID=A0ABX1ZEL8_9BACL|nr:NAD(P)/FAD-dependent oxidoreductase [Paenibacillus germinis]NOU90331.1 NAD(P)-binding protein [Paenibacillus germinis]
MDDSSVHVLIIGAGTGGLCLAHGLKKAGIRVTVYERDRTRSDGLMGYRVGIDPDGSRALYACLPSDLYDTFIASCARSPIYGNMLTEQLSELLSMGERPAVDPIAHDPIDSEKSVSRMTLRQVLLTGLEDVVHFDKTFSRFEQYPNGKVIAYFEDGTSAVGDVLVAADGTSSRVRKQYLPQAKLEDSGLIGIAGKIPLNAETRALLPPKVLEGVSMVFAPKGYNCVIHVMEFKWDQSGTLKNGIGGNDAELLSAWPGLLYDNTRDYIMWGFSAAKRWLPDVVLSMNGSDLLRLTQEKTQNWHPNLQKLFSLTDPSTCFPINIRTSVPVPAWSATNVTLLGDAIHTMTPGRGVGANTALRDAALLCHNLKAVRDGSKTLIQAIQEYEKQMIDYGFDAVIKSRKQMNGNGLMHKPVIGRLVLAFMRIFMRVVNHLPTVKRRMDEAERNYRGAGRKE